MAFSLNGKTAIVGVAESDELGRLPDKPAILLHAEAARNALADAGLTKDDVDGLFTAGISTLELGEYLGIEPKVTDSTSVGGSSFVIHIAHAAAAIATGRCEVALVTHGESGRSRVGQMPYPSSAQSLRGQFEAPYGLPQPVGAYAMAATRHMHDYGTTHENLAEIAVATRKWAMMNPKAMMQDPITIQDVLDSRPIAYPFNLLDCCLVTDGGGAYIMTSAERAKSLKQTPVVVLGVGEGHDHAMISQMPSYTSFAAKHSGQRAFEMAGIGRDEIDIAMVYDSFTYTVLLSLEELGFCAKGEGGAFVSNQRTAPGGAFPLNTNGGGLSYTHTGMYGMFAVIEAVRQLRHDYADQGQRQVQDAKLGIVHGTGGVLSSAGTAILARG
ncbi:MAG TPA: acetyl-CoA acetyltransferase [Thermomicrobiales bacterium]|nr:acetyl-CoA acetyltransferase [Thermomicrobiales bacterium]HRA30696.1 acetyl-CoA acetyltransferase [Thermomicrobiales bacterium]